jgi:DNA-binding transcriptional LysR family regulator
MNSWVLDHLEKMQAFEAVVRNGSLLRASHELGVSQPALSRSVASLENVSGKKLLERSRLGCRPTPEGREIVRFFEKLLPMVKDLEQKIVSKEDISGALSVGTFESFAIAWWPGFLKGFYKDFPGLKLVIRTAEPGQHRTRLLHGALGLVVEACPEEHEQIISIKVGSDKFGFYAPKCAASEEGLPLVYVPHAKDDKGTLLIELLREHGVDEKDVFELDSFSAVYEFISAGLGVGALPERLAGRATERSQIRRSHLVPGTFGFHSICASFLSENRNEPQVVAVIRALRAYLAN